MLLQTNSHGLPMPPTATALRVVAAVAFLWAAGLLAAGFVLAGAVVGAVAVVSAALSVVTSRKARRSARGAPSAEGG